MAVADKIASESSWSIILTAGQLIGRMNRGKTLLLKALVADGILEKDVAAQIDKQYVITYRMNGWWGKIIDKIRGELKDNSIDYEIVRICDKPELHEGPASPEDANAEDRFREIET